MSKERSRSLHQGGLKHSAEGETKSLGSASLSCTHITARMGSRSLVLLIEATHPARCTTVRPAGHRPESRRHAAHCLPPSSGSQTVRGEGGWSQPKYSRQRPRRGYMERILNSTLRFRARPSSVSFGATGILFPYPLY